MVRDKTLDRVLERLRKPDATLVLTYTRDTVSGRSFHIQPDGIRIADETAQNLLEHPRVRPCDDGLFPGRAQSWRLENWRTWTRSR